jgi:hypothetical protein
VFGGAGSQGYTEVPLQRAELAVTESTPPPTTGATVSAAPATGGAPGGGTAEDKDKKQAEEEALYHRLMTRMRADLVRDRQRFHTPGSRG